MVKDLSNTIVSAVKQVMDIPVYHSIGLNCKLSSMKIGTHDKEDIKGYLEYEYRIDLNGIEEQDWDTLEDIYYDLKDIVEEL